MTAVSSHLTAAETFGGGPVDPVRNAAWAEENRRKIESLPPPPVLAEVEQTADPRDDPLFVPTPPGWRLGDPRLTLERRGPSYVVRLEPTGLIITFRDVRTTGELSADVSVAVGDRHLFRTTTTLSLTAREKLGKLAAEFGWIEPPVDARKAVFKAVEAVLAAAENVGDPVDLRTASLALPAGGLHVLDRGWPVGSMIVVAPGESGKSTNARACGVSVASGIEVIPGMRPAGSPRPVLYVAGEDPIALWHARSIEAICRGIGISRTDLAEPIELFDAAGRPLHRLVRALAERVPDFGAIILDSQQTLLPQLDANGGIRDRDSLFWNAVDQLERPVMIVAHPNRADARDWQRQDDGRVAGSEVNRDRARMAWRLTWRDERAVAGTSYRRYTMVNTKASHGPREAPLSFAACWTFGYDGDPGQLNFTPCDPIAQSVTDGLSPAMVSTVAAYQSGATTAEALMKALPEITTQAAARQRLHRVKEHLKVTEDDGVTA